MHRKNKLKNYLKKVLEINSKTEKKFLVIFLSLTILITLGVIIVSLRQVSSPPPENIQVTNQTERSLAISWTTKEPNRNCVIFTDKKTGILQKLTFSLNRFLPDIISPTKTCDDHKQNQTSHHVTLTNLKPNQEYFYRIASGIKTYDVQLYTLKTRLYMEKKQSIEPFPPIKTIEKRKHKSSSPIPLYGNVFNSDGSPAAYQTIYLKTSGAANQLSAVIDQIGSYYFDLTNFYTDKLEIVDITSNKRLILTVKERSITTNINQATPAPDLITND